jgi:hypothetical protein
LKIDKILFFLSLATLISLCGCQSAPAAESIKSKNDGAFEAALESTANEQSAADTERLMESPIYTNVFTSTDGNIFYSVEVELPNEMETSAVVQVTPQIISADQAQTIANVLFDGATMYEYSEQLSKVELEEQILYLKQILSDEDYLSDHYSAEQSVIDYATSLYENRLALYESQYAEASDFVEPQPCQWTFYPETHYLETGENNGSEYMIATVTVDGCPYQYKVCNRNESDYRIHSIFAFVDDTKINTDEILSLKEPSQSDVDSVYERVENTLERMELSDWYIYSVEVNERELENGTTGYTIVAEVYPTYSGVEVLPQEQLSNLKTEDAYASNYYYEMMEFAFSGDRLTYFEYQAPLQIVSIVNENVPVLSTEEITEIFETQMKLDDITTYQIEELPDEFSDMQIEKVDVSIDAVEFGLARIRIKNNVSDFYMVPAYSFRGSYITYNSDGSAVMEIETTFATINAVDGSIINTQLGY